MGGNPTNAKEMTRQYFDSLWLEQRLMDSCVPETQIWLYGKKFRTPIMTVALSHLGTFHPDAPNGMVDYAKGAELAGAVQWYGMGEEPEFEAVMATGASTIRIVKPYADEAKIERQICHAEELGALAVGMDIDHMFNLQGNPDNCVGEEMSIKSSEDLRHYVEMTNLPFVVKGVLSVQDAEAVAKRMEDMTAEMKGVMAYTGVKDVKSFDASAVHRF